MTTQTVFDHIRQDHDKQRRLIELISKTQGDSEGRKDLWQRLKRELEAHARAEERVFYSPLLGEKQSRELTRHSVHEHVQIDEMIDSVDELDFDSPHWLRRFRELGELIEHHLDEEEKEVFPVAGRALSEDEKEQLAVQMQGTKDQIYYQELGS